MNTSGQGSRNEAQPEERGFWRRWYALVLGELIALIVLFHIFTRAFA